MGNVPVCRVAVVLKRRRAASRQRPRLFDRVKGNLLSAGALLHHQGRIVLTFVVLLAGELQVDLEMNIDM